MTNRIVIACAVAAACQAACAAGVKISERFGYDAEDATACLQAALDSGLPEIVVDAKAGPWYTRPLTGRSNQTIVFEKGAVIRAKRGEFHNKFIPLLRFNYCTNVVLRGSDPKTCGIRMWREDYADRAKYQWSEWRHAVSLLSCVNVTLEGIAVCESGGDGLYVSTAGNSRSGVRHPPCRGVTVRNCIFDRNYRQGISVIGVDGMLVEDTALTDTWGTRPAAGIDFEPNAPWEPLKNIVMRRCRVTGNQGVGLDIAHQHFDRTSEPISILFEDCLVENNQRALAYNNGPHDPDVVRDAGTITVRNCTFRKSREGAVGLARNSNSMGTVAFENVTVEDCGTEKPNAADFRVTVTGHTEGAPDVFSFRNVTVRQPVARPALDWMHLDKPYFGPPTRIEGAMTVVTTGHTEMVTFDDAWRAKNTPFRAADLPPSLGHVPAPLDNETVVDPKPGEMMPCAPIFLRPSGRLPHRPYVFYADGPRDVRLHLIQTLIGKRNFTAAKPIDVYAFGGTNRLARLDAPQSKEGDVRTFRVPAAGFYELQIITGGNGLALLEANVPVALNATGGFLELVAAASAPTRQRYRMQRHRLHFHVPEGGRFECAFAGEGSETLGVEVFDPSGQSVWRMDSVDGFARCQPSPCAGLWALEIGPPDKGGYEDHLVTLKGVPGWLFLTRERIWR